MGHETRLAARVAAVNRADAYAATLYGTLQPLLEPFLGRQVKKKEGGLLKIVAELLPDFPRNRELYVTEGRSDYELAWYVKTCEYTDGGDTNYYTVDVPVGRLRDGTLVAFCLPPQARPPYTVEQVEALCKKYREAKAALYAAEAALGPFEAYSYGH